MERHGLILAAVAILGCATSQAKSAGPSIRILIGSLSVKSPDKLMVQLQGKLQGKPVDFRKSLLVIKDENGKEVFQKRAPFGLDKKGVVSDDWISVGGAPLFKTSLPNGKYSMVWSVNRLKSNIVHFVIGSDPDELVLDRLSDGFGQCLVLLIYNSQTQKINLPDNLGNSALRVDDEDFKIFDPAWAGNPYLESGAMWAWPFDPSSNVERKFTGRHRYAVRFAGKWSNTIEAECKD